MKRVVQFHDICPEELNEYLISNIRTEIQLLANKTNPTPAPEYLTRKELSKILKVSIPTLIDWDRKGILHPYRIGNIIRYKSNELDDALTRIHPKTNVHDKN